MGSKEISLRVFALRKMKNLTQQQLADMAGVNVQTIRNIEAGKYWSSEVMDKLNEALDGCVY